MMTEFPFAALLPAGFGRFPAHPPSEVEWEELLARMEIAPRALRLAVDDSRADPEALAAELVSAVLAEVWLSAAIEAMEHGETVRSSDGGGMEGAGEGLDGLAASYVRLRTRNFVRLQRRGIDVWAWSADVDGAPTTMHQVLAAVVAADGARLARVRALGRGG